MGAYKSRELDRASYGYGVAVATPDAAIGEEMLEWMCEMHGLPNGWLRNQGQPTPAGAYYWYQSSARTWLNVYEQRFRDGVRNKWGGYRQLKAIYDDWLINPLDAGSGAVVATYEYQEASGALRYRVLRFDTNPKTFRHEWRARGVWRRGHSADMPLERLPFGLPLLAATPLAEPVWFPEGEKDVLALLAQGLVATTNCGGAGREDGNAWGLWKFRPELLPWFKNRLVIILQDNDYEGYKHSRYVAEQLVGVAADIKILLLPGLPSKGDVSDWLDAGHTADELIHIAGECPLFNQYKKDARERAVYKLIEEHYDDGMDDEFIHADVQSVNARRRQPLYAEHVAALVAWKLRILRGAGP